jgi:hypothetical protein
MDNKITVKSYLFLVFMFPLMIALAMIQPQKGHIEQICSAVKGNLSTVN